MLGYRKPNFKVHEELVELSGTKYREYLKSSSDLESDLKNKSFRECVMNYEAYIL